MTLHNEVESLEAIANHLKDLEHLKQLPVLINELTVLVDVLSAILQALNEIRDSKRR